MPLLELLNLSDPIVINSIVCAKGYDNYTWLHCTNQSKLLLATTLKKFETQLPSFIRVHKSSLINPTHIVQIKTDRPRHLVILMSNGMVIPVARRRAEHVRQLLD
ncbi:LytR/AlgR family response regulator transcription factor [Spirosoma pollinicola]|uniref:LytTR family transcriptional regulator n=1 Tax=Spirosoma pollinicola TaxID=2057025 RepID=A0A2K8ZA85_9BACT|nr:LytTR family transcriptional regulator [Spirosoma pollinicola]